MTGMGCCDRALFFLLGAALGVTGCITVYMKCDLREVEEMLVPIVVFAIAFVQSPLVIGVTAGLLLPYLPTLLVHPGVTAFLIGAVAWLAVSINRPLLLT